MLYDMEQENIWKPLKFQSIRINICSCQSGRNDNSKLMEEWIKNSPKTKIVIVIDIDKITCPNRSG